MQPALAPDMRTHEPEAATPEEANNGQQLEYVPMPATAHAFEMVDGVMHVFEDESRQGGTLFEVRLGQAVRGWH